jgi:succinate-semialdehyde dehydrogenase / glutarate-semialdehyde dehydrogenase
MTIKSINPSTGQTIKEYQEMPPAMVRNIIEELQQAFLGWRKKDIAQRAKLMKKVAQILRDERENYARLMAEEMGKPVVAGRAEAEKCAWACDYYADNTENFLQPEIVETEAGRGFITFQPLGVILAVMPWNFPFWQVFRFAAPALMVGNVTVLKHASNVPGCAIAIENIFHKADFPQNVFKTLLVESKQVGAIIENPLIKAVTLTGGTDAGRAIAKKAGEMIKKTVLELGGSDPYLIMEDADLEMAVTACIDSRLTNAGQSCIAAKRLIVVQSHKKQFEELFVKGMRSVKTGDPLQEETRVGPLARHDLRDKLHQQVIESIAKGAKCLLGGKIPEGSGAFYPPTVLTDVRKGMPAYDEEIFGPVGVIIPVKDEEEAIKVANDSQYGLGAAIFTRDIAKGHRIATTEIETGCCFVNTYVKSDPRLPFGGIKNSGYGRELSHYGIKEFVNIKTVLISHTKE